jgi:hypothetical protein
MLIFDVMSFYLFTIIFLEGRERMVKESANLPSPYNIKRERNMMMILVTISLLVFHPDL